MKKINQKTIAATLSLVLFVAVPFLAYAAEQGLVSTTCGSVGPDGKLVECNFNDLMLLVNKIIKFLLFDVSIPLTVLGFVWVGASLILSQNKESAWSDARSRFTDIGIGFGIMLGVYLLVKVVLAAFLSCSQIDFMKFIINVSDSCTP